MLKLLVLLPEDERKTFEVLPFLVSLHHNFQEAEINLLSTFEKNDFFNFFPFKINYFKVEESELSLMGCGQLAYRLHDVFNITHFFSLRRKARYSYVGRAFRAQNKIGFAQGVKKALFTFSSLYDEEQANDQLYLNLISNYLDKEIDSLFIDRKETQCQKNLLYFQSPDRLISHEFLNDVIDEMGPLNTYLMVNQEAEQTEKSARVVTVEREAFNREFFEKNITNVITDQIWMAYYCCLYGVNHIFITDNEREVKPLRSLKYQLNILRVKEGSPQYFMGDHREESLSDDQAAVDIILKSFNF